MTKPAGGCAAKAGDAYSVLTRLPAPHRLSPADALSLMEANFMGPVNRPLASPDLAVLVP
ncbi:MAG: hypothetical protein ACE15B_02145 [Bryobacteraceae bacterium]